MRAHCTKTINSTRAWLWLASAFLSIAWLSSASAQMQWPAPKGDFRVPSAPDVEVPEEPETPVVPLRRRPDPWTVVRPPGPQEKSGPPLPPPRILTDWEKCSTPSQDFEEVIRSCAVIIQDEQEPAERRARAFMIRAAINEGIGLTIPALADLNEVIALSPRTALAYERRGSIWLREKNYDQALKDFQAAIRLQPKSPELLVLRGITNRSKGDHKQALADFTAAIALNPKYEVAFYERGQAHLEQKELSQALADFRESLQVNPHFALGFYGIGSVQSEYNQVALAIAAFTEAQKLDPRLAALVSLQKGLARQRAGDCKLALEDYAAAMSAGLRNANILKQRGICWRLLGQNDFAILELSQSIVVSARDAETFTERGIAKAQKGDMNAALIDFNEAIKINPKAEAAYLSRAQIRRSRKELKEAIADIDRAIAIRPTAYAFTERGVTHFQLDEHDRAISDFNAAIELDSQFPMALFARGYLQRKSGDPKFSEFDMTDAVRRQPDILQRAKALGFASD